jgi:hypothetical protein
MQDNTCDAFRYRRRKRVVSMVAQTEVDTKEDPEVDMGMVVVPWIWRRRR